MNLTDTLRRSSRAGRKALLAARTFPWMLFQNMQRCLNPAWWSQVSVFDLILNIAHKGKSNLMLNRAKRTERETKEKELEKIAAEKDDMIEKLQREVNLLQNELDLAHHIQDEADKNARLLEQLYEKDLIDEEGNPKNSKSYNWDEA